MSEAESSIPQKVADLADALKAVRQHIGSFSPLDLAFMSCFPNPALFPPDWIFDTGDAAKDILVAADEFLKAVDTAEGMLNEVQVSVFEPLSAFTGGERWDVQTRRTLETIQHDVSFLRNYSGNPEVLLSVLRLMGETGFRLWQTELEESSRELQKRILVLQLHPNYPNEPRIPTSGQQRAYREPAANPSSIANGDDSSAILPEHPRNDLPPTHENVGSESFFPKELQPYKWKACLAEDHWIYENIHDNSFEELVVKHSEQCQSGKNFEKVLSRRAYWARVDRYADYHGLPKRRFKGACNCPACQTVTDTPLTPD